MREQANVWYAAAMIIALSSCGNPQRSGSVAGTRDGGDAAACGADPATCAAFLSACAELATSTPETIADRWGVAAGMLQQALQRMPTCIADRYRWLMLHPIEGVLTACQVHDDRIREIVRTITGAARRGHPDMLGLLRTEEEAICGYAAAFGKARRAPDAGQDARTVSLRGWCAHLFAGFADTIPHGDDVNLRRPQPSSGTVPVASPSLRSSPRDAPAATASDGGPTSERCPMTQMLARDHAAMVARTLAKEAWIAYGRALAACGPDTKPWEAQRIGVAEYRTQYIISFMQGDGMGSGWFQLAESEAFDRIAREWTLE